MNGRGHLTLHLREAQEIGKLDDMVGMRRNINVNEKINEIIKTFESISFSESRFIMKGRCI